MLDKRFVLVSYVTLMYIFSINFVMSFYNFCKN